MIIIHLNEQTKQAIKKGIITYLKTLDPTLDINVNTLCSSSHWKDNPKLNALRKNDIEKILAFSDQIHHSHVKLKKQVLVYLNKNMKTGFFKRSRLKTCIKTELNKIDAEQLDGKLLVEFQINKNTDGGQLIENLKYQLHTSQNNEIRARTNAAYWKSKFDDLDKNLNLMEKEVALYQETMGKLQEKYNRNMRIFKEEIDVLRKQMEENNDNNADLSDHSPSNDNTHEYHLQNRR